MLSWLNSFCFWGGMALLSGWIIYAQYHRIREGSQKRPVTMGLIIRKDLIYAVAGYFMFNGIVGMIMDLSDILHIMG